MCFYSMGRVDNSLFAKCPDNQTREHFLPSACMLSIDASETIEKNLTYRMYNEK